MTKPPFSVDLGERIKRRFSGCTNVENKVGDERELGKVRGYLRVHVFVDLRVYMCCMHNVYMRVYIHVRLIYTYKYMHMYICM